MPQTLPFVPSIAHYDFSTVLDGTPFKFEVRWNGRDGAWYMDLLDEEGVGIVAGVKIVLGALLGGRIVDQRFPRGVFQADDTSGEGREAAFDDLGTRVRVLFYPFSGMSV